jgi:hypothetical protein
MVGRDAGKPSGSYRESRNTDGKESRDVLHMERTLFTLSKISSEFKWRHMVVTYPSSSFFLPFNYNCQVK